MVTTWPRVATVAVLLLVVACGDEPDGSTATTPGTTTGTATDRDPGVDGQDPVDGTDDPDEGAVDPSAAALVPTVWPEVVVAGVPSEVLVSVAPRGEVSGAVTYVAGAVEGELRDEGGVYAAEFELTATEDVEVVVSATVDGSTASGRATITATAGDLPTDPAPAPSDPVTVTSADGAEVLADRIVVRFGEDVTDAAVLAVAEAIDGAVLGRLTASTWQLGVAPQDAWDELAAVLDRAVSQPQVLDASPVGVGGLDVEG